ncbi:MAG: DUF3017 domain-containing protein [Candidatus Nanopelagicales bacterium]
MSPSGAYATSPSSQSRRWWVRQWPITLVLALVALSLVMIATDHFRRGSVLLAASVILAFFLRMMLPGREAGFLVVRSRRVDVIVLGILGFGLGIFSLWVPAPS